jgi:hypothetical protein
MHKGDAKKLSSRLEQLSIPLLCFSLFSQQKLTFYLCGRKSLRAPFLNLERRPSFAAQKLHAYAKFLRACMCGGFLHVAQPPSLLVKENIAFCREASNDSQRDGMQKTLKLYQLCALRKFFANIYSLEGEDCILSLKNQASCDMIAIISSHNFTGNDGLQIFMICKYSADLT